MATYDAKSLLELWKKGEMTTEMAVGHLIQRVLEHEERLRVVERELGHPSQES